MVDPGTNTRLRVVFDNFFARLFGSSREGNYWILALDADYQTAMGGTDRRDICGFCRARAANSTRLLTPAWLSRPDDWDFPSQSLFVPTDLRQAS